MSTRRCKGKTKTGKPCKANPPKDSKFCRAHDPELPASARFGSRAQASAAGKLGGRPPNPRAVDIIRERMEGELDEWLAPLKSALQADAPYTVGWGEDAHIEFVPDHRTRLQALSIALDRSYGKPKQQTEVTGEIRSGPIVDLTRLSDEELAALEALTAKAAA